MQFCAIFIDQTHLLSKFPLQFPQPFPTPMNTQITSASLRGASRPLAFVALLAVGFSSPAFAQTVTWGGGDGEYTTPANWTGGNLPNTASGGTAVINSGNVTYTPGGDLAVNNGGTLQINGGSWTQVVGGAWIQLGGGSLVVAGGTFNQGTAGDIVRNVSSSITVSAGTANLNGNFIHNTNQENGFGTFTLSGTGTVNVANEFKPISDFTMSSGTLNVGNLISFADGPGGILFTGGTITVNGNNGVGNQGFYGGGIGKGLNFTENSLGTLFFSSYSASALATSGFLTNGTIQLNGAIDAGAFTVTEANGGVYVSLTSTIPEPSSFAALAGLGALGFVGSRRRRAAN